MWNHIVDSINKTFKTNKTGIQAENRYKTVLKRKKTAIDNNKKSGACRMEIPFENEINKIASIDDSIEPEVSGTAKGIFKKKKITENLEKESSPSTSKTSSPSLSITSESDLNQKLKQRKVKTIQETLMDIHEKRELAKERRHKEKLDLIKKLFKKEPENSEGDDE